MDDFLVNYLFLGGPNSNINRLLSVLPLLPTLVVSLTTPTLRADMLTKFLATAGVSLKSDFIAVERVVGEDVGYLKYLVACVMEIERQSEQNCEDPSKQDALRTCEDLVLDATASLLVCSMRNGGASSTKSWREVVRGLKSQSSNSLLIRLVGIALQRAARSEEIPWRLDLKEGMSRLCLLVEEKRLLKLHQGCLINADEAKLAMAVVEVMRVGRESLGWHQVVVGGATGDDTGGGASGGGGGGASGDVDGGGSRSGSYSTLGLRMENESLLKILQPCLRILLGCLSNIDQSSESRFASVGGGTSEGLEGTNETERPSGGSGVTTSQPVVGLVSATLSEIELTIHAASSGLAFAGARDVGLLVLASLRKAILCRMAAGDESTSAMYKSLVSIVVTEMAQRHEIERLAKESEKSARGSSADSELVEELIAGALGGFGSLANDDAFITPNQAMGNSAGELESTLLGWANYAGLGDSLVEAQGEERAERVLEKLQAYLDAFDECSAREIEDELVDLFGGDGGGDEGENLGGDKGAGGSLTSPHVDPEIVKKFVERSTAERGRVTAVRNETMVLSRRQNVVYCSEHYANVYAEMLPAGKESEMFERSIGDGGLSFHSRLALVPVKQQFTKQIPVYLSGSQELKLGEADGGNLMKSYEELGREIAKKASVTINNIAVEAEADVEEEEEEEKDELKGKKRGSSAAENTPSKVIDAYADTENAEQAVGGGVANSSKSDVSIAGVDRFPDGSLACGGGGSLQNKFICLHVRACGSRQCAVFLTDTHVILEYQHNLFDGEAMALEEARSRKLENEMGDKAGAEEIRAGVSGAIDDDEFSHPPQRTKALRYAISSFAQIYLRRYRLRDSGVEIFTNCGSGSSQELGSCSIFLDFGAGRDGQAHRDNFCLVLMKKAPRR